MLMSLFTNICSQALTRRLAATFSEFSRTDLASEANRPWSTMACWYVLDVPCDGGVRLRHDSLALVGIADIVAVVSEITVFGALQLNLTLVPIAPPSAARSPPSCPPKVFVLKNTASVATETVFDLS